MLGLRVALMVAATVAAGAQARAAAEPPAPLINNYGQTGYIDMPSARMLPDGRLTVTTMYADPVFRVGLNAQFLPWLQVGFRYSGLEGPPDFNFGETYYDRSFSVKLRLVEESRHWPDLTLGFEDIVGTGIYSGEYVVASKSFGDLDLSLGVGWGRLGGGDLTFRNPFGLIDSRFDERDPPDLDVSQAGRFSEQLFRGREVGVFGGLAWRTPLPGLSLAAEYSSDPYFFEVTSGVLEIDSQFNFAATYQALSWLQASVSYMYGNQIGFRLTALIDPNAEPVARIDRPVPRLDRREAVPLPAPQAVWRDGRGLPVAARAPQDDPDRLFAAFEARGLVIQDIAFKGDVAVVTAEAQSTYAVLTCSSPDVREIADAALPQVSRLEIEVAQGGESAARCIHDLDGRDAAGASLAQLTAAVGLTADPHAGPSDWATAVREGLAGEGLFVEAITTAAGEASVWFRNDEYLADGEAYYRAIAVLTQHAPPAVERFRLVLVASGLPVTELTVHRSEIDQIANWPRGWQWRPAWNEIASFSDAADANPSVPAQAEYPRFSWGLAPVFSQSLFDPASPYQFRVSAKASAEVEIWRGFFVSAEGSAKLFDNLDFSRESDSQLPRVRSDFKRYLDEGAYGISTLKADYYFKPDRNWYVRLSAGLLEDMFAGAGGEVLYRDPALRWAIGANLFHVWQRDFDRLFSFRDYEVTTGHVSFHYMLPWYELEASLHAGRYLAGDTGATFQLTRVFDSGIEIGAYFTLTDVPFEVFGEGSFDRGIIIRIPLQAVAPLSSRSVASLGFNFLTRDGGQRLEGAQTLYGLTRGSTLGHLQR